MAGAALAAGALSTAGAAAAGTTPLAAAVDNVAASTHIASAVSAGQAETSVFDSIVGVKSPTAGLHPAANATVQLDSRDLPAPDGSATAAHAAAGGSAQTTADRAQVPAVHAQTTSAPVPAAYAALHALAPATHALAAHSAPAHPVAKATAARVTRPKAAAAHPAAAHPAAAHRAPAHAAPAHRAAAHPAARQAPARPAKPYLIYDSVTPSAIPSHQLIATYVNGRYAVSGASLAGRGPVLWIDTNGSDTQAHALDVEPGDATPAGAAQWVRAKLDRQHTGIAIVYTMRSEWQAVKDDIGSLPSWMQSRVRYWIADPTGVPHIVPGSSATQWYWGQNYDITTANPDF